MKFLRTLSFHRTPLVTVSEMANIKIVEYEVSIDFELYFKATQRKQEPKLQRTL